MKNKIVGILTCLMLVLATVVFVSNDFKVEASPGGGGGSEDDDGGSLNYTYIWERVKEFANVTYDAYEPGDIPKGRSFGSKGGKYTVDYILIDEMNNVIGLEDVHKEQIGHIENNSKNYTSIINMTDFQITINNATNKPYPYQNPVPKTEMYAIPNGFPYNNFGKLTGNNTVNNAKIIQNNMSKLWPLGGTYTNYNLNITDYDDIGCITSLIVGNVTYLEANDPAPSKDSQYGRVYIMDDADGCQDKLDNITRAQASIIIDTGTLGIEHADASQCPYSVVRIDDSDGNTVKELLENYTVLVDNATGNLTFTYNLSSGWWPDTEHVYIDRIPDHFELWNITKSEGLLVKFIAKNFGFRDKPTFADYYACVNAKSLWWRLIANNRPLKENCSGIVLYDSYDYHFMICTFNYWTGESLDELNFFDFLINQPKYGPSLPVFTFNYSVGSWLLNNRTTTTLTGYADQELTVEIPGSPGIEAYNVIGNITIESSPDDAILILSNRYDGMWGQTPGDSAAGGAMVLGIAKYIKDHNITPKYNLTFLFTTGEEFIYRGAHHYNDSHPNDPIKYWIVLDQLCFDQKDQPMNVYYKNKEHTDIISAIVNQTQYSSRTGYTIERKNEDGNGSEQFVFSSREDCDTFCLVKGENYSWDQWHRTGSNYNEGDSLKHTDRNDVNVTAELVWNITKYFAVDPDCWFDNAVMNVIDSDDTDDLVDTVTFSFDVISTLPHDLAMVNTSLTSALTNTIMTYETMNFSINRSVTSKSVEITVPSEWSPSFYVFHNRLYNSTGRINEIIDPSGDNTNQSESSDFIFLYPYGYNLTPPVITNVSATPDPIGYGQDVTISADVTSNISTIDTVKVNIVKPQHDPCGPPLSFTMTNTEGDTYEYVFNDTWQHGEYTYVIWAKDSNGNESGSSQYSFNVSAMATVSVCTVLDEYGNNTFVNVTDPPSNPPLVGYELLDGDKVLRIWNGFDSYYFNTSNGIQFTNHYDEYWSHNVLMLGYYNNDQWNLIYRTDELSGFNKDIESDDESYVNATLWTDLTYQGYDFRLAIRYHLGVDDNELTVIPYIKNIDDKNIPYNLGFAWEINNIQIDMTPENDYIEINGTWYYLNESLDETYKNMDSPCFYIREDISVDKSESLYLRWNKNLNYVVRVKSREGQYNAPVTLGIKIGALNIGQEKFTKLFWHDASEIVYYFNSYNAGEAWTTNPGYMVDGSMSNYASTTINGDVERCNGNNCSGTNLGDILIVELRVYGYYSGGQHDTILQLIFGGTTEGPSYPQHTNSTPSWSEWCDITMDLPLPSWGWGDVSGLDVNVEAGFGMFPFTLYCSKVEVRVTYIPNNNPVVSDPYPVDGSTGISISPVLNITVVDPDGDNMNITWLSNSSGSWQVFGTNNSVGNGTYHQVFSNASVNGEWWYWKVNVTDGVNSVESDVYNFYTGFESKIKNTGSTNISGYLLMQVQYYDGYMWVVAVDGPNETTPRTINIGEEFGLDTVFNGKINTADLIKDFGTGLYRVYACFRDPDGTVLVCDDESLMEDSYEFTVSES